MLSVKSLRFNSAVLPAARFGSAETEAGETNLAQSHPATTQQPEQNPPQTAETIITPPTSTQAPMDQIEPVRKRRTLYIELGADGTYQEIPSFKKDKGWRPGGSANVAAAILTSFKIAGTILRRILRAFIPIA